jgi:hypothetical protein
MRFLQRSARHTRRLAPDVSSDIDADWMSLRGTTDDSRA